MGSQDDPPVARMRERHRARRGHGFLPSTAELAAIPGDHETEGTPTADRTIHLHYFSRSADWWIAEAWQDEDGDWMAYGYTRHNAMPGGADWGEISLDELEAHPPRPGLFVERDLDWRPVPFWRVLHPFSDYGYGYIVSTGRALGYDPAQIAANCQDARDRGAPLTAIEPVNPQDPGSGAWWTLATVLADWPEERLGKYGLGAADAPAGLAELDHPAWRQDAHQAGRDRVRSAIAGRFPGAAGTARTGEPGRRGQRRAPGNGPAGPSPRPRRG